MLLIDLPSSFELLPPPLPTHTHSLHASSTTVVVAWLWGNGQVHWNYSWRSISEQSPKGRNRPEARGYISVWDFPSRRWERKSSPGQPEGIEHVMYVISDMKRCSSTSMLTKVCSTDNALILCWWLICTFSVLQVLPDDIQTIQPPGPIVKKQVSVNKLKSIQC